MIAALAGESYLSLNKSCSPRNVSFLDYCCDEDSFLL